MLHVVRSEWLKRKRSFATTLVVGGSLFTPAIVAVVRLLYRRGLPAIYASETFWRGLWSSCWESMAVFFLPMAAILITSLVAQIEFRANAWKQVHAQPVSMAAIFTAKLAVIAILLVQFLALFNAAIYVSGMLPAWILTAVPFPHGSFAALPLWRETSLYFVHCLPIVALQYLIALRAANVLVPIGAGFLAWVGALALVSSRYAVWWPYSYTIIQYVRDKPKGAHLAAYTNLPWIAAACFVVITAISYVLFITKPEKG